VGSKRGAVNALTFISTDDCKQDESASKMKALVMIWTKRQRVALDALSNENGAADRSGQPCSIL
jgi:hypothetical protein